MPAKKRFKTAYPGVYYIEGKGIDSRKKERIYYIIYRKHSKIIEEKAGRQFKDKMTAKKAAKIRIEHIEGKRLSRKEIQEQENARKQTPQKDATSVLPKKHAGPDLLEKKWLIFREASSDRLFLYDSELNLLEINKSGLEMFPTGTMKEDIIGKNLLYFLPHTKKTGEYDAHLNVIRTGKSYEIKDFVPPAPHLKNEHVNIKVFKVGDGVGVIVRDITELKRNEEQLIKREVELQSKARDLEETNTALKVLLKRRDKDREDLKTNMLINIRELVLPYLLKLKNTGLNRTQQSYVALIESNLDDIVSPFLRIMSMDHLRLTPAEIQIADHIKRGRSTKQVAELLFLSNDTIDFYRKNIRKKLGLQNKKVNLRTYLIAIEKMG
jgi:DNA-binding CsgD family transcriptional regulator